MFGPQNGQGQGAMAGPQPQQSMKGSGLGMPQNGMQMYGSPPMAQGFNGGQGPMAMGSSMSNPGNPMLTGGLSLGSQFGGPTMAQQPTVGGLPGNQLLGLPSGHNQ